MAERHKQDAVDGIEYSIHRPLDRSTFIAVQGQTDYQYVYCERALTN